MRNCWVVAAATMMLAGCGLTPGDGPKLTVAGPSAAVEAFVRRQGAHSPTRATTFPSPAGDGRATATVLMPAGTGAAAMHALAQEAIAAGLKPAVVATAR